MTRARSHVAPVVVTATSVLPAMRWCRAMDIDSSHVVVIAPAYETRWDHVDASGGAHVVHLSVAAVEIPEPAEIVQRACTGQLKRLAKVADLGRPDKHHGNREALVLEAYLDDEDQTLTLDETTETVRWTPARCQVTTWRDAEQRHTVCGQPATGRARAAHADHLVPACTAHQQVVTP